MRKFCIGMTASTIILSIVGAFLRRTELLNAFDPTSGLAYAWTSVTIVLALLTLASAVFCFYFAFMLRNVLKNREVLGFNKAFCVNNPIFIAFSLLLAIMMVYAAYDYYRTLNFDMSSVIAESILALFAAAAGISFLSLTINAFRKHNGSETVLCCFVIVIFFCYWLIITYKQRAADPVLLDYVYDALALCSSALAAYYVTGFCFAKSKPAPTLFFTNLSIYLCSVSLVGASPFPFKLFYIFSIAIMLIFTILLYLSLNNTDSDKTNLALDGKTESASAEPIDSN